MLISHYVVFSMLQPSTKNDDISLYDLINRKVVKPNLNQVINLLRGKYGCYYLTNYIISKFFFLNASSYSF